MSARWMRISITRTTVDNGVLCDYTELGGICVHNFEFDCSHTATNEESVAFAYRAIGYSPLVTAKWLDERAHLRGNTA